MLRKLSQNPVKVCQYFFQIPIALPNTASFKKISYACHCLNWLRNLYASYLNNLFHSTVRQ